MLLAGLLSGCMSMPAGDQGFIHKMSGNYVAFSRGNYTLAEMQEISSKYNAVTKFAPSHGAIASATESTLTKTLGPSRYMREVASDIQAMMNTDQHWTILILPENRDFMTSIFKLIPDLKKSNPAKIKLMCDPTPELSNEIARLGFVNQT